MLKAATIIESRSWHLEFGLIGAGFGSEKLGKSAKIFAIGGC